MYLLIKNAHIAFALISISMFVVRAIWSIKGSELLSKPLVRTVPHLNDSLLLACAIYLMVTSDQYPIQQAWLSVKLLALVAYIAVGHIAIKSGRTPSARFFASLVAVAIFSYIFSVALTKSPTL
ncbi:MAG: SirB2 family protein [Pseudomonadota bacterium]